MKLFQRILPFCAQKRKKEERRIHKKEQKQVQREKRKTKTPKHIKKRAQKVAMQSAKH